MTTRTIFPLALLIASLPSLADARVVINEIMYHAPDGLDDLQFVELHNPGEEAADLSGWACTKGIKFKFAAGARLEANGFLVLCRSAERFKQFYRAPVSGVFDSTISHKGERLELTDARGKVVDSVKFNDRAPWPTGADGYSGSLERISPEAASDDAANWAASPLSENRDQPTGTPGQPNAGFSAELPPVIENVRFTPESPAPNEAITVEADVRDAGAMAAVNLRYQIAGPGFAKPETSVPMEKVSEKRFVATIPGQAEQQLIRFRIQAAGAGGAQRFFPAETEPRPALSAYGPGTFEPARIPFGWILHTTEAEFNAAQARVNSPGFGRGGGFGPGGFPGGGPAPDPLEPARARARARLERELDLSLPWFELTVNAPGADTSLPKLKELFLAKLTERNRFIDDLLARGKTEEQLRIQPEVSRLFLLGLADTARAHLSETPNQAFGAWLAKGSSESAVPFTRAINSRVDLEGAWHAVTLNGEIDPARLAGQRQTLREFDQRRRALLADVASGQGRDTGFRDQRDRAETLGEKLVAALRPQLSPAQARQLESWRTSPRETTVGYRAPPPAREGPQPGFGGGPGGFGGFGGRGRSGQPPTAPASHRSAFVYFDPATRKTELFDFVQVTTRNGGQKIHFLKDQPLRGMTTINLIFEGETASLVEPLAYEVYRRAGMAAEQSYLVRLWQSGRAAGYHLLVEQPNRAFLRRNHIRDDGDLYKLLWYERGVIGQHEKKTNPRTGHDELVALNDALKQTTGDAQWEVIRKHFEVEQVANYFAVNTVLSHWDGFFNNYFTYQDTQGTGKWTMYPWDQDSTWGLRAMRGGGQVFFDMPITFGMTGDAPPGRAPGSGPGGGFGFGGGGGGGWWRQPGWFSGPLLANPQFRKLFLARTKEILETIYTEEVFGPVIAAMEHQLEPEVKIRAEILKSDPARAVQNLKANLEGCREHLRKRRAFLLAQNEIQTAGK